MHSIIAYYYFRGLKRAFFFLQLSNHSCRLFFWQLTNWLIDCLLQLYQSPNLFDDYILADLSLQKFPMCLITFVLSACYSYSKWQKINKKQLWLEVSLLPVETLRSACSDILSTDLTNSISHPKKDRLQSQRDRTASVWTATVLVTWALKTNTWYKKRNKDGGHSGQRWTVIFTYDVLRFSNW